jgi:hypothetical protein
MKKYLLLTLVFVLGLTMNAAAQNGEFKNTISASAGLNIFQFFNLISDYSDETTVNFNAHATASYGLTYDYGVTKWFSIGLGGAYNKFSLSADEITIDKGDGTSYTGPIDAKVSRTNIGIRPLFHYGNGGRVDMYSGFRLGANIWKGSVDSDDPDIDTGDINSRLRSSASPNFQFIPFGLRGYVTKNLGLGFELAFGAPHYAAFQLSYRM